MISRALDTTPPTIEPLAVDARGVARLLDVSERHVWAMHSSGRLPMPFALGRCRRWRVAELRAWLAAGCPPRDRWQVMRDTTTTT